MAAAAVAAAVSLLTSRVAIPTRWGMYTSRPCVVRTVLIYCGAAQLVEDTCMFMYMCSLQHSTSLEAIEL